MNKLFQWVRSFPSQLKFFLKKNLMAVISGVLVGTTYIPFPPWALLFCYVPLWLFLSEQTNQKTRTRDAFWAAWVTQAVLTLIGFHWIAYTAHEFANIPWVFSVIIVVLFSFAIHLYIPLAAALGHRLKEKFQLSRTTHIFTLALLFALAERVWPSIFPWHLGYTLLWAKLPIYQLSDLVGFEGLSTWILLFNAWIAVLWIQRENRARVIPQCVALIVLFVGLNIWGVFHVRQWQQPDATFKANIIQANIGNLEKVYAEKGRGYQSEITQKFLKLSRESVAQFPDSELLIWPETAYPNYLDAYFLRGASQTELIIGLSEMNKPLLTGAYSKEVNTDIRKDQSTFNALFLVGSQGQSYSLPYRKTYLLAFGEYLPLSEQFPFLLKLLPFVSNFGRGLGPAILDLPLAQDTLRIGGQICYEGLYPDFTRGLVEKGAEVLVNVTNDSWFGYPFEPNQHLYMTLARAIEVRRPLLRSTNTGISTAILANGDVLQKSPLHKEWYGQFILPYKKAPEQTVFTRYGHWDWIIWLIVLIVLVGGSRYARTRRS